MNIAKITITVFIVILAVAFSWPILTRLPNHGIWDWSEAVAHYESARFTIINYGQIPLWNPYLCGGGPALANPQTYWLSLTGALAIMIDPIIGSKLAIPIYISIGSFGLYLLARHLKISRISAMLAPPIFLTSGFMATHLSAGQFLWLNLAWVPWIFLGFLKSEKNWLWLIFGASFLTMIGLEGRSYLVAYVAIALGAYSIIIDFFNRGQGKAAIRASLLLIIAFGLGAWKFIPDLQFLSHSTSQLTNSPIIPINMLSDMFLLPDVSPNAEHFKRYIKIDTPWFEFAYYLGLMPLSLATLSLFNKNSFKKIIPWIGILIIFTYIVLSDPQTSFLESIPIISELRNQQRAAIMSILALSLLAPIGLDNLKHFWPKNLTRIFPAIQLSLIIFVIFDLLIVTSPALAEGYAKGIKGDGQPPPVSPLIIQGQGANDPWPTVRKNQGASGFCPAILQAWYPQTGVLAAQIESYQGEAFLTGPGQLNNFHLTPNIITAQVNSDKPTQLTINQNANPGWKTNIGQKAETQKKLLAVDLPPGNHQIKLSYSPPGIKLGILTTLATLIVILTTYKLKRPKTIYTTAK